MAINQLVNTPIGKGRCQGTLAVSDQQSALSVIRLPINEQTRDHLKKSNCLTPRASKSGLWVFARAELS